VIKLGVRHPRKKERKKDERSLGGGKPRRGMKPVCHAVSFDTGKCHAVSFDTGKTERRCAGAIVCCGVLQNLMIVDQKVRQAASAGAKSRCTLKKRQKGYSCNCKRPYIQ